MLQKGSKALIPVTTPVELPEDEVQSPRVPEEAHLCSVPPSSPSQELQEPQVAGSPLNYLALHPSTRSIRAIQFDA